METSTMPKKIVEYQKFTFGAAFEMVANIQDQVNRNILKVMEDAPAITEESQQLCQSWIDNYNRGRQDFRVTVDRGFDTWLNVFEQSENKGRGTLDDNQQDL